jgi:hypothetical protein
MRFLKKKIINLIYIVGRCGVGEVPQGYILTGRGRERGRRRGREGKGTGMDS